jgi:hypothetical protein
MSLFIRTFLVVFLCCISFGSDAQISTLRKKTLPGKIGTYQLDSLSIYPNSFFISCGNEPLGSEGFKLDHASGKITILKACADSLTVSYRVLPMNLGKSYFKRDTTLLYSQDKGERDQFLVTNNYSIADAFGGSSLTKKGSISRGVTFGNNQDFGVNSSLNLELAGDVTNSLKLVASVSDDNLPIQPNGNTNKLQEFDQVFIKLYNQRFALTAGDFWLYKPKGYFLTYRKRAQGLSVNYQWNEDSTKLWQTQVSGALSKGKFARQIVQGVEGNQGPYRLIGNENEPFIIVLSGTEKVYIDGKLLERGQEFDYIINYNSAEVIFTARNLITKDSRIVIEFQYSDQNYARSLVQTSTTFTSKKTQFWFNVYSEQDAKNQSLQQELTTQQKNTLAGIGDSLQLAQINSIDSIGFLENQNLYKMIDSLGFDSVLVYSVAADSAVYRAVFTFVGDGKGDYVLNNFNALGKVFKWVAPIAGVKQGNYIPSRLIITPKKKQFVNSGVSIQLTPKLRLETDLAYSKNDLNNFSAIDSKDDDSYAARARLIGEIPLSRDTIPKWVLESKAEVEFLDRFFSPIEQYRAVEFDRDWNTRNKGYLGNQLATTLGTNFKHNKFGNLNVEGQQFSIGNDYLGIRAATNGKWNQRGFQAQWDGSYLSSSAENSNQFIRHRTSISQQIKWLKIGYIDDHELNRFNLSTGELNPTSYQFYDGQVYLANADSMKWNYKIFYRERYDRRSSGNSLIPVAKATSAGAEVILSQWKDQKLTLMGSYRELRISDSTLIDQAPENTILGRIDYEFRALKGMITWNTFYEIGSGLELKREFIYIQVNAGQGVYAWIDYNNDGVKDLNEFEIAQFADQASYIRVFTPSNEYTKTFSNELNQSIYIRPERIWSSKKGIRKFIARFSDQARIRINRKTNLFDSFQSFNPFFTEIRDSNLISTNSTIRNTVFFNRTSSVFGAEYTYQNVSSKTLLASGFDSRSNAYHELSLRANLMKQFTIESKGQIGTKASEADYTTGRNYNLTYYFIQPSFIYQPSMTFRISLDARYANKQNGVEYGNERAQIYDLGSQLKWNQSEKSSLQAGVKWIQIGYDGDENSALGFEMLEALKPGTNYTWNAAFQRSIGENLQLSIQYNGRKSENNRTIHAGGMELRALF